VRVTDSVQKDSLLIRKYIEKYKTVNRTLVAGVEDECESILDNFMVKLKKKRIQIKNKRILSFNKFSKC